MATTWGDVASRVQNTLKSALPYAKVTIIGASAEYISSTVGQSVMDDLQVLIAPPEGSNYVPSSQPLIGGMFRKRFEVEILVVSKSDPKVLGRLLGPNNSKKGIDAILSEIHNALEHDNLGGLMDNKAGANFEEGWSKVANEDKAITIFTTIYTAIKTER